MSEHVYLLSLGRELAARSAAALADMKCRLASVETMLREVA